MENSETGRTERQQALFEYWSSICGAGELPCRRKINPGRLGGALGHTSLVERRGEAFRFRLMGSRLEGVFGRDANALVIDSMDANIAEAGSASMAIALDTGRPVCGHRKVGTRWHCWLRLPLLDDDGNLSLVLCLDEFPTALPSGAKRRAALENDISLEHAGFAA